MKIFRIAIFFCLVLPLIALASPTTDRNKANAIAYMQELEKGENIPAAFERYIGATFVHHSPQIPEGRDNIMRFLAESTAANRGSHWELRRAVSEGDLVVLHGRISPKPEAGAPNMAIANIFRFDRAGKIVEEWAVLQAVPETSANSYTMF